MRRVVNIAAFSCAGLGLAVLLLQAMWWTDQLLTPMPPAFEYSVRLLCAGAFTWLLWSAFAGGKAWERLVFFGLVGPVSLVLGTMVFKDVPSRLTLMHAQMQGPPVVDTVQLPVQELKGGRRGAASTVTVQATALGPRVQVPITPAQYNALRYNKQPDRQVFCATLPRETYAHGVARVLTPSRSEPPTVPAQLAPCPFSAPRP